MQQRVIHLKPLRVASFILWNVTNAHLTPFVSWHSFKPDYLMYSCLNFGYMPDFCTVRNRKLSACIQYLSEGTCTENYLLYYAIIFLKNVTSGILLHKLLWNCCEIPVWTVPLFNPTISVLGKPNFQENHAVSKLRMAVNLGWICHFEFLTIKITDKSHVEKTYIIRKYIFQLNAI